MDRRQFLTSLGIGTAGVLTASKSLAEAICTRPIANANGYAVRNCTVGIPSGLLRFVAARQQSSQWCWAACIQMVFRVYGYDLPQALFVQQTWGSIVDMPGSPSQILSALNRTYIDNSGRRFTAVGDSISVNISTAINDLSNRSPLIIGSLGHATVLTALSYNQSNAGEFQLVGATVRDPWPTRPSRRILTPQEWNNANFAARVRCFPA
jgi:hypothetical protein